MNRSELKNEMRSAGLYDVGMTKSPNSRVPQHEWAACHPLSCFGHTKQFAAESSKCHPTLLADILRVRARFELAGIVLHHNAGASFPFITVGFNWNHLDL